MRSPDQLAAAFRAQGLKLTPQRQLLFRLLHDDAEHLTADALHAQAVREMPGISLRTVYTTLADLTDMGEVQPINLDGGATRFDTNVADHHHAVCDHCGRIADVVFDVAPAVPDDTLGGFVATGTSVVVHGSCAECAAGHSPQSHPTPQPTHEETSPCQS